MKVSLVAVVLWSLLLGTACEKRVASEYPPEVSALATEGGEGLPYYVGADLRPAWETAKSPSPRMLTGFDLVNQNGRRVTNKALKNKISFVSFFYTECPGICPLTTRNLRTVQDKFKANDRVVFLSFSITPTRDTPAKLAQFAKKHQINSQKWHLLTGDRKQIYNLARESFNADTFSEREDTLKKLKPEDFLHSENVYLLDDQQKIRGIYQGREISSLEELTRDAESLL